MNLLVFDVGGTAIKHGRFVDGVLTQVQECPTEAHLGGQHILDTLISLADAQSGYDAIGVSTAGQVNAQTGTIIYANSNLPDYTGMEIRAALEAHFHVPAAVENDVNSAALGEALYGAGRDVDDFLCLTYGTGVGGAIVQNKQIYHGSSFSAAEFGAIVTHSEEKIHQSDFFDGCYERYASTTALVKHAMAYDPTLDSGRKIFARLDDANVLAIIDRWVDEIMLGLTTLTHIFNPPLIVLGGGVMSQPLILEKIEQKKPRYIMPSFAHVQIKAAALGNTAGLYGAAVCAGRTVGTRKT